MWPPAEDGAGTGLEEGGWVFRLRVSQPVGLVVQVIAGHSCEVFFVDNGMKALGRCPGTSSRTGQCAGCRADLGLQGLRIFGLQYRIMLACRTRATLFNPGLTYINTLRHEFDFLMESLGAHKNEQVCLLF